jgi:hypothetical protein
MKGTTMNGTLDVLNCCAGHMSFSFDNGDPLELERAKRVVTDMLKRGYALFIEDKDGKLAKVKKFDPKRAEYIIADGPLYAGDTCRMPAHIARQWIAAGWARRVKEHHRTKAARS